jgi:hypothetical protein
MFAMISSLAERPCFAAEKTNIWFGRSVTAVILRLCKRDICTLCRSENGDIYGP